MNNETQERVKERERESERARKREREEREKRAIWRCRSNAEMSTIRGIVCMFTAYECRQDGSTKQKEWNECGAFFDLDL